MIVVVGEALIDIVAGDDGRREELVGGGPLNIAVGLSRLDEPALLITQTGDDAYGEQIAAYLHGNEVELVSGPTSTGRTNTATATLAADGSASYAFDLEWTLQHQELPRCDALHVGSLGTALEPGRGTVVDLVEQAWAHDVFISFDPNLRTQFLGDREQAWRDVESLADRSGLVKMSNEDVDLLHPGADPADIARSLLGGDRTELVVITHGASGAAAYTKNAEAWVDAPTVDHGRHGGRRRLVHVRPAGDPGRRRRDRCVRRRHARRRGIPDPADRRRGPGSRDHLFPSGG